MEYGGIWKNIVYDSRDDLLIDTILSISQYAEYSTAAAVGRREIAPLVSTSCVIISNF